MDKESIVFHDLHVNTDTPLNPDVQIWPPRLLTSRQIGQETRFGTIVHEMQNTGKSGYSLSPARRDKECDNNNGTSRRRQNPLPLSNSFENETGRTKMRIDSADKDIISGTDSTCPSTASVICRHSKISSQNSPTQVIL